MRRLVIYTASIIQCQIFKSVRNLGVHMDSTLSMNNHVSHLCKTLIFQLRNISCISIYIDFDSCNHIVRSLIISHLDYGNSLLTGTSETNIKKFQRLQNRAVRRDHVSPYRAKLHLLSVKEYINFKLLTIIYQWGMDKLQPICSMTFNFVHL